MSVRSLACSIVIPHIAAAVQVKDRVLIEIFGCSHVDSAKLNE